MRLDSGRARDIRVTIVEGMQLLGSFDVRLREYAAEKLHKQGVQLVKVCPCLSWIRLMQRRTCRIHGDSTFVERSAHFCLSAG